MNQNIAIALLGLLAPALTANPPAVRPSGVLHMMNEASMENSEKCDLGSAEIGQVAVSVKDLGRAVEFYRNKLGIRHLFTANGMAFFDSSGIRLMLAELDPSSSDVTKAVIYFKVPDIRRTHKALLAKDVHFEEEPELAARTETFDLWLACFRDSENNRLCLMSETARLVDAE